MQGALGKMQDLYNAAVTAAGTQRSWRPCVRSDGGGRGRCRCRGGHSRRRGRSRRAGASHGLREIRHALRTAETTGEVHGLFLFVGVTNVGKTACNAVDEGVVGADALGIEPSTIPDFVTSGELSQAVLLVRERTEFLGDDAAADKGKGNE
ncbi:hypothetical protein CIB48_g7882 [Xylaria polymorpha]|nr:hypothetical protein CIB48_g7882 [Xylaria polymorpha]